MFIKKINRIQAPKKASISRRNNKKQKQQEQAKQSCTIGEQKDDSEPLRVFSVSNDPHGCLLILYSEYADKIFIVSIPTLLDLMDSYRQIYAINGQFTLKAPLECQLAIDNPRPELNIFKIKLSRRVENTQLLVVAYYNGDIDIYSVLSGQRINSFNVNSQYHNKQRKYKSSAYNLNQRPVKPIGHLFNINIIGHSIFISTYDQKLYSYQGFQLIQETKYDNEWVRFTHDYENIENSLLAEDKKKLKKKVPIYQDIFNNLKIGNSILKKHDKQQKQMEIKRQKTEGKQKLSQSYIQFLKLQTQKQPPGFSDKYTLTPCEKYIVCRINAPISIGRVKVNNYFYVIRSKQLGWNYFQNIKLVNYPFVNQFWTLFSHKNGQKAKDEEQLIIATLGDCQYQNGKLIQSENDQIKSDTIITILKLQKKRSKKNYKLKTICRLTDLKWPVISIDWIGPNIFVYVDEKSNFYYVEITLQVLAQ